MDQAVIRMDDVDVTFGQRYDDETKKIERKKLALRKEKKELEKERGKLENEKRAFLVEKISEDRRMEREKKLFEMKWKILEDELKKLAAEKAQVEKQRKFYQYVTEHEMQSEQESVGQVVRGELFFAGVSDKKALKKRYKDLLKIYHPDNASGDIGTVQEINREYDRLQAQYQ